MSFYIKAPPLALRVVETGFRTLIVGIVRVMIDKAPSTESLNTRMTWLYIFFELYIGDTNLSTG